MGKRAGANIIPEGFLQKNHFSQVDAREYPVDLLNLRVHDAASSLLPATSANDDLGLTTGTMGSASNSVRTSDMKTLGAVSRYARFQFVLPPEYVAGETVTVQIIALTTALADTSSVLDLEVYKQDSQFGVGGDVCATGAQDINSLQPVAELFTVTPTTLSPGDILDCRITVTVNDAAGGSAVTARIDSIKFLLDVKG